MNNYLKMMLQCFFIATLCISCMTTKAQTADEPKLALILKFYPTAGKKEAFKKELHTLLNKLAKQSNFVSVAFHEDVDDPNIIILYEVWKEENPGVFMQKTNANPDFQAYQKNINGMLSKPPEVQFLKPYNSL
ncbi:putative quinol monooxygenase [Aquimarina sp. 2304DJ70-9]|uniref:putative quinol monooxygenase n=1 Tax=Aquimarina penaris TaxID=3231044 RepID=UPI00346186D1